MVSVSDMKDTSSLTISWSAIPEEHVQGKLLGYHVMYKPTKIADQPVDPAESLRVTTPASGWNELTLTSLSSFHAVLNYSGRVYCRRRRADQ